MPTRDREVEVRGTAAEKEITVDRRGSTSIRVSCDASPACPFQEKNGRRGWWMAPLTGEEQSRVSPEGPRGENDYFLAKWFWLELHLNLVWDGTLNQYSNTEAAVWLNSLKGRNFIQTWISWLGYTESSWPVSLHGEHQTSWQQMFSCLILQLRNLSRPKEDCFSVFQMLQGGYFWENYMFIWHRKHQKDE